MSNIITHTTNLPDGSVQAYATSGESVTLDLQGQGAETPLVMSLIQALALSRILEASIRDAQQGTYSPKGE